MTSVLESELCPPNPPATDKLAGLPVLDDSALGADVLEVDGVEVDGLSVALDAAVGAGEMPLENESGGERVTGRTGRQVGR
jgi:hypothetical protein